MKRILVIRGGAIGDFIVTLPAIKALRDAFPAARIEIIGYKHIAALAENRYYAEAVRSIEYAPLAGFFAKNGKLDPELSAYFGSFDLVISYLFDPDGIFQENVGRVGAKKFVTGPAKIRAGSHAARQLSVPVRELGIDVTDLRAKVFPSSEDLAFARQFLGHKSRPTIALHVGSGSAQKNWPLEKWLELGNDLLTTNGETNRGYSVLVVSGEADAAQVNALRGQWRDQDVCFATNLPLPQLAAILAGGIFVGHDSGISHLAAAVGANCLLLFGPTDPEIWAPLGDNVQIVRATNGRLGEVSVDTVADALIPMLEF